MGKHGKYRPLVRFFALVLALWPSVSGAACRQALAIGLDISGSVDGAEYDLQMHGLAGALEHPDVMAAFLAIPDTPVRLYVFEWAGPETQRQLTPWQPILTAADLSAIANQLRNNVRQPRQVQTALGLAMTFGAHALQSQSDCWRLTLDLSGDGESNNGPAPQDVKALLSPRITINAIVIGQDAGAYVPKSDSEIARLTSYFRTHVIRGPDAFVQAALGFEEFQDAMTRKLLKELETLSMGHLVLPDQ